MSLVGSSLQKVGCVSDGSGFHLPSQSSKCPFCSQKSPDVDGTLYSHLDKGRGADGWGIPQITGWPPASSASPLVLSTPIYQVSEGVLLPGSEGFSWQGGEKDSDGDKGSCSQQGGCHCGGYLLWASPEPASTNCSPRTELGTRRSCDNGRPVRCSLLEHGGPGESRWRTGRWKSSYSGSFPRGTWPRMPGLEALGVRWHLGPSPPPRYPTPLKKWLRFVSDSAQNVSQRQEEGFGLAPRGQAWGSGLWAAALLAAPSLNSQISPGAHQAGTPGRHKERAIGSEFHLPLAPWLQLPPHLHPPEAWT